MGRVRNELSVKNKYHLSKHRYLELKHFCLQYPEWKKALELIDILPPSESHISTRKKLPDGSFLEKIALQRVELIRNIELVERIALNIDEYLGSFILRAVTQDLGYEYLKGVLCMACGKDMYYDRYRKFFYFLSQEKGC